MALVKRTEWPASTTARPERDGEMRFADAGRAEDQHVFRLARESAPVASSRTSR